MGVIIYVNKQPFQFFKQVNVSKSLDEISGHCQITVSEPKDDLSIIKNNDLIDVLLDGVQVLAGYQEHVSDEESEGNHPITFEVRDVVQDLIDSSVPPRVRTPTQYTDFTQIIDAVLKGLGLVQIGINNQRGPLPLPYIDGVPVIKQAELGSMAGDYLNECARIVSCIMNSDGIGNILLRNFTNEDKLKTMLLFQTNGRNNNVLDATLDIDYSQRFGTVKVWSNGNVAYFSPDPLTGLGLFSGTATDEEIRSSRILEFMPQEPLANNTACKTRAQEEVNIRRARSFNYTVKVQGFSANGQLWDIGKLVRVQDDKRRVKGWLLIKSISYEYTLDGGAITTMSLTFPDAYQVTLTNDASNLNDPNSVSMGVTYGKVPIGEKFKQSVGIQKSITSTANNPKAGK